MPPSGLLFTYIFICNTHAYIDNVKSSVNTSNKFSSAKNVNSESGTTIMVCVNHFMSL